MHSSRVAEVAAPAVDLARAIVALKERVPAANVTWMLAGTPEDVSRTVVPGTARAGSTSGSTTRLATARPR